MKNNIVEFLRKKDYTYLKDIGQGGLGKTVLLKDEMIGEQFVCKKYSPADKAYQDTYFKNFVQEIKLLHLLYHRNIVTVFFPRLLRGLNIWNKSIYSTVTSVH